EAEHGGAVADHGDEPVGPGVAAGKRGLGGDGPAHLRHAGRVGDGEVAGVGQRRLEPGGELATLVRGEDLLEGGLQVVQEGHEGSSWGAVGSERRAPGPWVRARTCRTATARSRAAG